MSRRQQVLVVTNGLLGGLVAIGVTELRLLPGEFEFRLGRAWLVWSPRDRSDLPAFEVGTHDFGEVLTRLHTSHLPFRRYWPGLEQLPHGLTPDDYLRDRCAGATVEEWKALARAFMDVS